MANGFMKLFEARDINGAIAWASIGGQALHRHKLIADRSKAPKCFVRAIDRGEYIAHLFDQDRSRLEQTVKALGVRIVIVERVGTAKQHVDLCGRPLERAVHHCRCTADLGGLLRQMKRQGERLLGDTSDDGEIVR